MPEARIFAQKQSFSIRDTCLYERTMYTYAKHSTPGGAHRRDLGIRGSAITQRLPHPITSKLPGGEVLMMDCEPRALETTRHWYECGAWRNGRPPTGS